MSVPEGLIHPKIAKAPGAVRCAGTLDTCGVGCASPTSNVVVGWLSHATVVLIGTAVFTDLSFYRGGDLRPHPVSRRAAHEPA